jgi:hypothetical protein
LQLASIHPFDPSLVARFVAAIGSGTNAVGVEGIDGTLWLRDRLAAVEAAVPGAAAGQESSANVVSLALAQVMATAAPSFVFEGLSLTTIEATVDRGVGMLLRPPSRMFIDHGFDPAAARTLPIRLDNSGGMMGGAFIPPHLVPQLRDLLTNREDRIARRLHDAGFDAIPTIGLLNEMAAFAADRGLGLYEALDAVVPDMPRLSPPGAVVVVADRKRMDRETVKRLTEVLRPKRRGLVARLMGNGRGPVN